MQGMGFLRKLALDVFGVFFPLPFPSIQLSTFAFHLALI